MPELTESFPNHSDSLPYAASLDNRALPHCPSELKVAESVETLPYEITGGRSG